MNIYKVEQDWNNGYDTFDSFVCVAENEQAARETYPSEFVTHGRDGKWFGSEWVCFSDIQMLAN
jgi:hypothetical protein